MWPIIFHKRDESFSKIAKLKNQNDEARKMISFLENIHLIIFSYPCRLQTLSVPRDRPSSCACSWSTSGVGVSPGDRRGNLETRRTEISVKWRPYN